MRLRWQQVVRTLLALFAIGFATVVYLAIRERQPAPAGESRTTRTDPKAIAESSRGESLMARGTQQDFKIQYDRLFTYARGEALSAAQREALANEKAPDVSADAATRLLAAFDDMVDRAIAQLRDTPESVLTEPRHVGRARLPSTVLGLLFHAAEHTQRHAGQVATTARIAARAAG